MTAISPTHSRPEALQRAQSAHQTITQSANSDFNTFLTMLSAQMRNQDPLNPIESSDYATQLATFSGVEQQILTNTLLRQLISGNTQTGISEMSGWLGRTVAAAGAIDYTGAPLTLDIRKPAGATSVSVEVKTAGGAVVQTLPVPADGGPVQWAGVAADGSPLPAGRYSFVTVGHNGDKETGRNPTPIYRTVDEVRVESGGTRLVLSGGTTVTPADIVAIKDQPKEQ